MPTMGTASVTTGVVSMVLLTVVVVLGISVNRHGRLPGLPAFAGLRLHRYCSLLAVALIAVHVLTAVAMASARITLVAAVIPSVSLWLGLGAVSFDLLVALVVTSLLRRHLGRRWWRPVHWLAYACWPAAMAHSIAVGPGLHAGRLFDLAAACVLAVLAAGTWRLAGALRGLSRDAGDSNAGISAAGNSAAAHGIRVGQNAGDESRAHERWYAAQDGADRCHGDSDQAQVPLIPAPGGRGANGG
jgi:methionine sulfoxide reductase heme-binding subunit